MANLGVVPPADVAVVESIEAYTLPAAEAIDAGEAIGFDSAGKAVLADADTGPIVARGIAVTSANAAGDSVHVVKKGLVDIGDVMTGIAVSGEVFTSGTPGLLADATVNAQPAIGYVHPAWGYTTVDLLLRIDL